MVKAKSIIGPISRWNGLKHFKQLFIVAAAYFIYMFVRKYLIIDIEAVALSNALKVISFEVGSGFFWEPHWQKWAIGSAKDLVLFLNWAYIVTFWPILLVSGVILYLADRQTYFHYRNVVLLSFIVALLVFAMFPLAPPRYLPEYGFVDTIQRFGPAWYGGREMQVYYNAFAAMPSLHFSWTVLFGVMFLRMKHKWLKPLGIIYPTLTFFAITVTGNHYVLDAIGGLGIITATFLIYQSILRVRRMSPSPFVVTRGALARAFVYAQSLVIQSMSMFLTFTRDLSYLLKLDRLAPKNRRIEFVTSPATRQRRDEMKRR